MTEFSGLNIHHYGLATNDLEKSIESFRVLGYEVGPTYVDPLQKVKLAFVSRPGEPLIEIICDLDTDGPTQKIVAKSGSGFYHLCYEVDDIEQTIEKFRVLGFLLRHKPVPAVAFAGRKIAWLYHRYIGLVELLEKPDA